ncbi:MAG: thiamine diphosphokinase [Brevefilum sp.]
MSSHQNRIFLFANGPLTEPNAILSKISPEDFLIAVDGGLRHLVNLLLSPNLIIGDLDSANPESVDQFIKQNVEVRRYPQEKDQTDLELAIDAALGMNPAKILIAGALGDRIDQTLGNIFLLTKPELADVDLRFIDGDQEVFLIQTSAKVTGQPGQRISLLPIQGVVRGVRTKGLKYPLDNETLFPDQTRGISNLMLSDTALIEIEEGYLLCVHEFSTINSHKEKK